jgi:hypothetical protein
LKSLNLIIVLTFTISALFFGVILENLQRYLLAPSYNENREINDTRLKAIHLIAGVNEILQEYLQIKWTF